MEAEKHESDMTPGEKRKKRLEVIRSLHGRKRAEYLWTYYKSWLLILLLAALGIAIFVCSFRDRHTRVVLSIAVADTDFADAGEAREKEKALKNDLLEALGDGKGRERIDLDTSVRSGDESAMAMKRMVVIGSGNTDLFICGLETYRDYQEQNAFRDWRDVLGDRYEEYADLFENGTLDLSKSSRWESYGLTAYSPALAGVPRDSGKQEEICGFLDFFFR